MNKEQTQIVNMIDSSMALLNMPVNKAIWIGNPTFSATVTSILTNMGNVNLTDSTRLAGPQPFTETKGQAKEALITATLLHAAAGRGYATGAGNTGMKTTCTITETSLIKCPDADLGNMCRNIYTAVQPNIGSMGDWACNATTLAAFNLDINTFNSLVGTPQAQISTQHAASGALDTQLTTIKGQLTNTIDTLMVQFKSSHAAFYEGYFSTRVIHNTGVHHSTTFKGNAVNAAGAALPHIQIVLTLGGNQLRKHFTDANGHFRFTRLHLGDFELTASGAGVVTQTKTYNITDLQSVEVTFTMVPIGGTTGGGTTTGGTTTPASA